MPNWVSNSITIEGSPDLVNRIKEQVSKPYVMPVQSHGDLAYGVSDKLIESPFSFWNIITPIDLEAYVKQPDFKAEKPFAGNDWYNWNNRNWGTKWDSTNADLVDEVENGDNLVLVYNFETPWGTPNAVLIELSRQYPSVLITNEYQEETGWGGETEFLRGEITAESDYNWKCWECDYVELDEPPYCEDCEFDTCPSCGYNESSDPCDDHKEGNK